MSVEIGRSQRRPPITLRRGRTRRGYWITVTSEDWEVIHAIERGVRGTGLRVDDGNVAFAPPNPSGGPVATST